MRIIYLTLSLLIITLGGIMAVSNLTHNYGGEPPRDDLPHEPGSPAELLSATHLFTAEILTLKATPWSGGADGLEHRQVDMRLRLQEVYKGQVSLKPNETFPLLVEQRRESEFIETDYHGLWSHAGPAPGVRYLVVADAAVTSPSELMQEGPCQKLLPAEYESDVRHARQAETLFKEAARNKQEGLDRDLAAARSLLNFTQARRTASKDLFARYLWARVGPAFLQSAERLLTEVTDIITAESATLELRMALIHDLYEAVLLLEPNPDLSRRVIKAFFSVLLQGGASSRLHQGLIEVQLYNLIFHEGKAKFARRAIYPENAAELNELRSVLTRLDSERARQLSGWLRGE